MKTILILLSLSLGSFTYALSGNEINRVVLKNINGECEVYNRDSGETESCTEEDINLLNNTDTTAEAFNNQTIIPHDLNEDESLICSHAHTVSAFLSAGAGLGAIITPIIFFADSIQAVLVGGAKVSALYAVGTALGFTLGFAIVGASLIAITYTYIAIPFMNNMCDIKISHPTFYPFTKPSH